MIPVTRPSEAQHIVDTNGERAWLMLIERYGKTFRHLNMVVTCEPAAVQAVLMDRAHVEKRPFAHKLLAKLPGASGVLFMDGEPWLTRARALAPVFHRHNIADAAVDVYGVASRHVSAWASAPRLDDLYAAVQQIGAEIMIRIGFGFDFDDPRASALSAALVSYKNRSMQSSPSLRMDRFTIDASAIKHCPHIAFRMWRDHSKVRAALRSVLSNGKRNGRADFITRLQEAGLTDRELANEVNHLYTAYNAIDYVVTCGLYELAKRPAIAAAIRAEIDATLGPRRHPAIDDLKVLPATNAFMLEVLRRYPATMGVARSLGEPLEIGGEMFPAGTQVLVLLHALHHHPEYWDDPWEFKPGRWTSPHPRVPYSYVPFLLGARKCMGRDMAEQHFLLVLAAAIRRFDISVFADATIQPYMIPRFAAPIPFSLRAA